MKKSTAQIALEQALLAVGLQAVRLPAFFMGSDYMPLNARSDSQHVVVLEEGLEVYAYSTDLREPQLTKRNYKSLQLFVRDFVMERIDHASTAYMGTIRQDAIERIKVGEFQEFLDVRNEYKLSLVARLENYLRSDAFAELSGASGSHTEVKTYRWSSSSISSPSTSEGLSLRNLWAQQQQVSVFGTFVASPFCHRWRFHFRLFCAERYGQG